MALSAVQTADELRYTSSAWPLTRPSNAKPHGQQPTGPQTVRARAGVKAWRRQGNGHCIGTSSRRSGAARQAPAAEKQNAARARVAQLDGLRWSTERLCKCDERLCKCVDAPGARAGRRAAAGWRNARAWVHDAVGEWQSTWPSLALLPVVQPAGCDVSLWASACQRVGRAGGKQPRNPPIARGIGRFASSTTGGGAGSAGPQGGGPLVWWFVSAWGAPMEPGTRPLGAAPASVHHLVGAKCPATRPTSSAASAQTGWRAGRRIRRARVPRLGETSLGARRRPGVAARVGAPNAK